MLKTKNKNILFHSPLVIAGYILFGLLVALTLVSTTIPFGVLLFNPKVQYYNVTVILVAFTVGMVLPVLLGYLIGDHSVKTKNRQAHHFNGVLFGLLAYWVMVATSFVSAAPLKSLGLTYNAELMIINTLPSVAVALVVGILALSHIRSKHALQDVVAYKPFSILLIAAILMSPLGVLFQNIAANSVNTLSFIPFVAVVLLGFFVYVSLHKTKLGSYGKVVWSAVSLSVLCVAVYVIPQLITWTGNTLLQTPAAESTTIINIVGYILAISGWVVYWTHQVRTLRGRSLTRSY